MSSGTENRNRRGARCAWLLMLCLAAALWGCGKNAAGPDGGAAKAQTTESAVSEQKEDEDSPKGGSAEKGTEPETDTELKKTAEPGTGVESKKATEPGTDAESKKTTEPETDAESEKAPESEKGVSLETAEREPEQPEQSGEQETSGPQPASPSRNGRLHVEGTQLVGEQGEPVQLRGVSTHGLAWFPQYVNAELFQELHDDWKANVVRLAMYTSEYGGYCNGGDQEALKKLIRDGVQMAGDADLYVIVDWHILSDSDPRTHQEEAKAFFAEMAEEFRDRNNVIYEICNEPNGSTSWEDVRSYAGEVTGVIREKDPEALVLVGTPEWSQRVDQAAEHPITEYDNIMYSLHFYAATHKEDLRERLKAAVEAGLPVFVTEYGICDASGNGALDEAQAAEWIALLDAYQISYVAWNLSNKEESSAMIASSCEKTSGFSREELSACGQWVFRMLNGEEDGTVPAGADGRAGQKAEGGSASQTNTGAGNTQDASGSVTVRSDDLEAVVVKKNGWEADGRTFTQYDMTVRNLSESPRDTWTVELEFTEESP